MVNLEKLHGANPSDAAVVTTHERAHRISMLADAEVERLKNLKSACLTENLNAMPQVHIHTAPVISNSTHSPKMGEELNHLALQSLIAGLLTALLLPYLLELAFPPCGNRASQAAPLDAFDLRQNSRNPKLGV